MPKDASKEKKSMSDVLRETREAGGYVDLKMLRQTLFLDDAVAADE